MKDGVYEKLKKKYKRCRACGKKKPLEFHHLIPRATDLKYNWIPLCHECHKRLHQYEDKMIARRVKKHINNWEIQTANNWIRNNRAEKTEIILRNKFADLKKDLLHKFDRLEEELKSKLN